MDLGLFNNIFKITKDENQEFKQELENSLNENKSNNLKQEGVFYQVVEIAYDGIYLQNTDTNIIDKETDISNELKDKIDIDSVLKFENNTYVYDEKITEKFMNSFIGISEFRSIKEKFAAESNILNIDSNTVFTIEKKENNFYILSYDNNEKNIKAPKELISFWAKIGDRVFYKNGKFDRE